MHNGVLPLWFLLFRSISLSYLWSINVVLHIYMLNLHGKKKYKFNATDSFICILFLDE